jgi:hypothetical protein
METLSNLRTGTANELPEVLQVAAEKRGLGVMIEIAEANSRGWQWL